MPYNQTPSNEAAETAATSATGQPDHNGLGFSASGHPAAGVTQRSECGPYKAEVAGSNPAARTITPVLPATFGDGWMSSSARDLCKIVSSVYPSLNAAVWVRAITLAQRGSGKVNIATICRALDLINEVNAEAAHG